MIDRPARALRIKVEINGLSFEGWQLPSFDGKPRILYDDPKHGTQRIHPSWKVTILDDDATVTEINKNIH